MLKRTAITAVALSVVLTVASQNAAAQADVKRPAYALGEGPMVVLDVGHNNADDPEFPVILAETLVQDGYVVRQLSTHFDEARLAGVDIVISKNPLPAYNPDDVLRSLKRLPFPIGARCQSRDRAPP